MTSRPPKTLGDLRRATKGLPDKFIVEVYYADQYVPQGGSATRILISDGVVTIGADYRDVFSDGGLQPFRETIE